jgi:hypothetical protein
MGEEYGGRKMKDVKEEVEQECDKNDEKGNTKGDEEEKDAEKESWIEFDSNGNLAVVCGLNETILLSWTTFPMESSQKAKHACKG